MAKRKVVPMPQDSGLLFDTAIEAAKTQHVERELAIPGVRLGTSAFTAPGWSGRSTRPR